MSQRLVVSLQEMFDNQVCRAGFLLEESRRWGISPFSTVALLVFPFLISSTFVVLAVLHRETFKWLTTEDGLVEYLQVTAYVLSLLLALHILRRSGWDPPFPVRRLYLLLSLGLFFLIGEEISWGQRLFGVPTPQVLLELNRQREISLHNIYGVEAVFRWGQLVAGAYGTFLPYLLFATPWLARFRSTLVHIVPPLSLVPFFLLHFVWRFYGMFFGAPSNLTYAFFRYNEVSELILSLGIFLFLWYRWRILCRAQAPA